MDLQKILVTGAAGFIGFHLTRTLLRRGYEVVGIDSLNDYYDVRMKHARLERLGIARTDFAYAAEVRSQTFPSFRFRRLRLEDREKLEELFATEAFDAAVNLAAQAGVRHSLENPYAYVDSNVLGYVNLLECCRRFPVRHMLYASSSSVYGGNTRIPFSEADPVDDPVSVYAATKRSDELLAGVYAHLCALPLTGLRFFTVYGPWGRPDMAPMLFSKAILAGEPVRMFNYGDMARDFTYVDDIAEGVVRLLDAVPAGSVPAEIYNIGSGSPVRLTAFIRTLEEALGRKARLVPAPMQPGDVPCTYADTGKLQRRTGFRPQTTLAEGIARFAAWYLSPANPLRPPVPEADRTPQPHPAYE